MQLRLKIFIIIIMLLLLFYVIKSIRDEKNSIRHALIWIIFDIIIILCVVFIDKLFYLAAFLGIETVSNLMFFIGFIILLIICFNYSSYIAIQNKKIINLTQELGILKNKINEREKK